MQRPGGAARGEGRGGSGLRERTRTHFHGDLRENRPQRRGGLHSDRQSHLREDTAGRSRRSQHGLPSILLCSSKE